MPDKKVPKTVKLMDDRSNSDLVHDMPFWWKKSLLTTSSTKKRHYLLKLQELYKNIDCIDDNSKGMELGSVSGSNGIKEFSIVMK